MTCFAIETLKWLLKKTTKKVLFINYEKVIGQEKHPVYNMGHHVEEVTIIEVIFAGFHCELHSYSALQVCWQSSLALYRALLLTNLEPSLFFPFLGGGPKKKKKKKKRLGSRLYC